MEKFIFPVSEFFHTFVNDNLQSTAETLKIFINFRDNLTISLKPSEVFNNYEELINIKKIRCDEHPTLVAKMTIYIYIYVCVCVCVCVCGGSRKT